tara:strand:+ start:1837 stop:3987 length:2151 start_codon:yes stop_codon:yes gene_type:complete
MQETTNSSKDVQQLQEKNIYFSEKAAHILNNSTSFDELGRAVFLDRYSIKTKRDDIQKGDLVIAITKEDHKYPKKDLGIVKDIQTDKVTLHMITGLFSEDATQEFQTTIWKCDKPKESITDAYGRIANAVASMEKPELQNFWKDKFYYHLSKKHIQPAGRIMTGANTNEDQRYTKNLTLYNCYVIPCPKDSRQGIIGETLYQMTEIMSRGGGVGISLSSLRPRYAYVRGVHGKSSGSVSWGGLFSYGTALIEQGGSRRGALMLMQADWHPDIEEFINAKRTKGMIENANISVMVSDKFMNALKNDANWDLIYPDYESMEKSIYDNEWEGDIDAWQAKGYPVKVYKTVRASELWDQITKSAHASAEPGIVFMERYNKESNSHYFNKVICTNPCGEQGLPAWGVCNLGHLYLASFLKEIGKDEEGPLFAFDWDALRDAARTLGRFLDNVIDLTPYHFKENEVNQKGERRIGGGTLGLGELLIKMRLKYGAPEAISFIDEVYKVICFEMYKTSALLAKEKGAFPKCESEKLLQSGFTQKLPEEIKQSIRENGLRNVTLITQAPTGTVGTMLGTSTGIEPYYAFEFFRQSRLGFHKVDIPLAQQYKKEDGTLPDYFTTAMAMTPMDHIRVQAAVQKWTDSSISKTANAPENFTIEETKELYEQAYDLGCKGVTIYRDNSRSEQVLSIDEKTEQKNADSSNGGKCELEFDDNGQIKKSCSE